MANIIPVNVAGLPIEVPIDTDPTLAADSDLKVASQKATKAYVDDAIGALPGAPAPAIPISLVDAKGDIVTATADNTPARLAAGTNGYHLEADSGEATGLKWASKNPFNAAVTPKIVALIDGANIAVNAALGNIFRVTIDDDRTMANPTGLVDGQVLSFEITQGAGAPNAINWDTAYYFTTSNPEPTLSASGTDIVTFKNIGGVLRCIGTNLDD